MRSSGRVGRGAPGPRDLIGIIGQQPGFGEPGVLDGASLPTTAVGVRHVDDAVAGLEYRRIMELAFAGRTALEMAGPLPGCALIVGDRDRQRVPPPG